METQPPHGAAQTRSIYIRDSVYRDAVDRARAETEATGRRIGVGVVIERALAFYLAESIKTTSDITGGRRHDRPDR
jgi:hypothetical protein